MYDSPIAVMKKLAEIEDDLAVRQNEYEEAADDRARLTRHWDYRLALAAPQAKGSDVNARKASALVFAIEQDDLYERLTDAEGRYDALRVVVRTMETRATIAQSILKAQGRG